MADPISSLRTNRGEPTLFDRLSTAGQISQEDQYAANPESQFSKGLRAGAAGLTAGSFASEALRKEVAGDKEFADSRDRALQTVRDTRMYAPRVSSLRDVNSIGDAGDFAAGAIGQGAMSMVPTIAAAALTRGRGLAGKATAFGGAMVPAYEMERGEAALNQYQDPEQMKASAQERDLAATAKGGINAALESIVPAGLGGSLLRKPAGSLLGHVGREAVTEGLTEGAQQLVGFGAQKYLDPNKELDPWDVVDAVAAGALTGGAMSAATRGPAHAAQAILDKAPKPQMPEIKNPFQRGDEAGGVVDLPEDPSGGGSGPADTMLGKVAGLGAAVQDRFGDDIAAAGAKTKDVAGKAKDIVSDTLDRMTEAVNTAGNPGEFLNKVFGGNIDEEASADMSGQPNPALKGATFEETEANIQRDDEQRISRAARYADELLNDPATPDAVKERVAAMGGDYTNPDNQSFVARTLVAQRGGEKVAKAVQDLVDLGKSAFAKGSEAASSGLDSAKKAVGDAATAAQDRIVKKNLQSATPAEQAAFGKVIFDGLTDEAKASPLVRAQLSQVTNAIMAFAAKTGDITAKDLPTLTKLSNAMSLFKDPDAMAQTLVEYAGLPRTEDSFLSRIKRITNAQQDLKQPNSFLVSSLTPEAKSQLTAPQLQRIAQLVDQFTLIDSADSKKGTALVQGLANAFGSPESAKAVLDYYSQQNKADLRFDPNEGEDARPRSSDDIGDADDIEGFGTLSEQDAKELVPRFRSPNINRPFFRGRDDAASAVELSRGGDLAQRVSMAEHVRASGDSAKIVAGDIRRDLMKRLNDNVSRDTESVRGALRAIEAHLEDAPSNGEWAGYSEAVALRNKLRGTKTEDRSAIVKALRDELKALDSAAEKAKRSGKDADEAMLELYDVVLSSPDSSKASDAQMTKFRKLLDTSSDKKTKAENDAIRKTGVTFKIDGKKVAVSLESMVYNSPVRGSVRERLLESLGLVAARADEMPNIPNDAIVKRNYFGDGRHLTWGRLMGMGANPDVKSKARKEFETDPAKEAIKAELDKVNASNLREYMDNLPKDVDALSAGAGLLSRIEGQIEAAKEQMEENPSKVVGDRIRNLSSKRRVLKTYLNEILDADYPVSREAIMDNLESELQAGGIVNKEGQKTEYANILFKEELIQTYRDRADAVKGTSLADDALAKADELAVELDKDLAKLQDFQRMDLMDRPSGREPAGKRNDSTSNTRARLKRVEESLAATDGRVKDRDALEQLRDDLKAETEGAEPIHALDRMVDDGIATLRDGIYYVRDAKATKHITGSTKSGRIYVNIGMIREKGIAEYVSDSPQKMAVLAEMGITGEQLQEVLGNNKRMAAFLRDHELSHKKNNDRENYPKGADGKLDLNHPRALAIEARATFDALTADEREKLGVGNAPPTEADFRKYKGRNAGVQDPKAEPGSARQSTMKPKRGRPGKIDQQAILDEIARIRGKDVKVAFAKFADIGASGEFSMNRDKTNRLIKIAINSLNPMSVAWHESLHDFMAMLGGSKAERKLKADLLAASEAPQVMTKLRELLKGHPDAIKQIETDREERLAYMYQFWAEGALPLGQTGTNIFSRMVTFFREMLGVLSQDQKIDQLFTALHTGKFSEPSLVGAVLEDLKAQTLGDKARAVAGPIGDAAEAMFTGATDRLRNTNVDALTELADMFHREPGRENSGELPFLQRRAQQVGKRLNKLQDILKDTTSEERRRALENMQAMKPASTPLEKELAAYLKEMRDYMADRGVKRFDTKTKKWTDLGNVKDYFPRVWDKEAIRNNEAEFINLMEQYIGKAQARETFNALVNGDGSLELAENEHSLGFTPWNPSVLDRQFTFINPSNAAAFAKFQSKDMADIMTSYTQRAVHRAEYASTFGNDGEVITKKFLEAQKQGATQEELEMARKATMAMEGTLGYDFNPRLKEVMSGIVTYQNIVLLPLSLFSNLIDPLGVAMRSNDMKEAWKAFTYGIKGIADQLRGAGDDAQTEMAKMLGIIDEQNMLEAMGHVYNSMHMSRFLKNINSKFFRYNGMEMWNQRMRVAAMMAAQRFILSHAENLNSQISHGGNKNDSSSYENHSKRYLDELGIAESDVFQLKDGTIALTKDQLLQAGAKKSEVSAIEKRIQAAVFKWVDGAVLRPNAAHRPVWGSDPRYQLIFHLKQFTFSFHNTILRRVGEELKHGNVAPGWILLSYVPFMFLSDVMKGSLTGTLNTTADLYDVASQSIARSGIMGTGVFGADAMGDLERGKLPGTSFLGPAFDHLMTLLSGITGHAGADQVMNRSVPFAKFI